MSTSKQQKIKTKSSTKTKLVAVDDKMGDIILMRHFLTAQRYTVTDTIIYQDNLSTLALDQNGRMTRSATVACPGVQWSHVQLQADKHIEAKYFFVKDYIGCGLSLKYCTTKTMWADVLTKPFQGAKFGLMRAVLMNCPTDYFDSSSSTMNPRDTPMTSTSSRECAGTPLVPRVCLSPVQAPHMSSNLSVMSNTHN